MKKFYELTLSHESDIIGVSNGLYQAEWNKKSFITIDEFNSTNNYFSRDNILYLSRNEKLSQVNIPIKHLSLLKKAKLTDIIGYAPNLWEADALISSRFKKLIEKFNIQPSKFFRTELIRDNAKLGEDYYFLYIPALEHSDVIFNKSQMFDGVNNVTYFDLKNQENYSYYKSKGVHGFSKICLKKEFEKLDLIHPKVTMQLYVSEGLKTEMEKNSITGASYKEAAEIIFE